jgi:hypothetical protein
MEDGDVVLTKQSPHGRRVNTARPSTSPGGSGAINGGHYNRRLSTPSGE